jgi:23S rRNA-/tRNA-specific pseudouridylate synthase
MRTNVPVLESKIERQFAQMVRARGGMAIKMQPTIAGVPDRMVLWPNGRFSLVELKTLTGRTRPIQIHRHKELKAMGHLVVILRGELEIQDWVDDMALTL